MTPGYKQKGVGGFCNYKPVREERWECWYVEVVLIGIKAFADSLVLLGP
jgi:hypothetical protein